MKRYRRCVGLVVINKDGLVFVGKRIDSNLNAWQMPQGGIENGESPRNAGLRELKEEIGTNNVKLIGEMDNWLNYDSVALIKRGYTFPEILVDQGEADSFLDEGLRPWLLSEVCENTSINLELRMHPNYDHSYYFISTFMADHLNWHRDRI